MRTLPNRSSALHGQRPDVPGHLAAKQPLSNSSGLGYFIAMSTVREIEAAIEKLPLPERLRLYKDMPQLIGRSAEDLDWQRLGLENIFHDDSPEDSVYDNL